jgi:tetratricopeptide (TPR) repeat protein
VSTGVPQTELAARFYDHVTRATQRAEAAVTARPKDADARYELGAVVGLQASYTATVEGKLLGAFRIARRAFNEHERVLEIAPNRQDAKLIVGTYRYVVSTLSAPLRLMAYVAGFGGGRERGIQMLQETAAAAGENRTDAMFALVLVYNRERRYDEALRILQELRKLHPRNRLVLLETGSTALRAGRPDQAEAVLTEGLGMLAATSGPRIPAEETLWRYKRGAARVAAGRPEAARADLQSATTAEAQKWVQGRARVELARAALKRGDRGEAAGEARQAETLCQQGQDPVCLDEAKKLLRTSDGR